MFRLRSPAPLTYEEVGASFDAQLPPGYHHVRAGTVLGRSHSASTVPR